MSGPRSVPTLLAMSLAGGASAACSLLHSVNYLSAGGPADSRAPTPAGSVNHSPLCEAPGWCSLPRTTLSTGGPPVGFSETCNDVASGLGAGVADVKRNRLVLWNAGSVHVSNEVYALSVAPPKLDVFVPPSASDAGCPPGDDKPAARVVRDGAVYIASSDEMFVFGGEPISPDVGGCGAQGGQTWFLDLETGAWKMRDDAAGAPKPQNGDTDSGAGNTADYDPVSRLVFLHDTNSLWSYDRSSDTYAKLREAPADY